jgi:predicted enzyme related to lactoylglutathione lyase
VVDQPGWPRRDDLDRLRAGHTRTHSFAWPRAHHYTIFYVAVEDIIAALAKAEALGGKKIVGPIPIPTGTFAWFSDIDGNTIGLVQPKA